MLSESHFIKLRETYGLDPRAGPVSSHINDGTLQSLEFLEVQTALGRSDIDSPGLQIQYPNTETATIRLDVEPIDENGKKVKLRRHTPQQSCGVFDKNKRWQK